jgi:type II secretory pathway pseudopilin PulG
MYRRGNTTDTRSMNTYSTQAGFSLVETLVAITLLLLVIVGPMTITSSAARSTSFSSEQVTAFFLAQEGSELIQKARDDLQLQSYGQTGWNSFTNTSGTYSACYNAAGCGVTIRTDATGTLISPLSCSPLSNCNLYLNTSGTIRSRFTHTASGATITPYTRRIFLQNVNANEVKVVSRVTWKNGGIKAEQLVEVETRLFNTYGN